MWFKTLCLAFCLNTLIVQGYAQQKDTVQSKVYIINEIDIDAMEEQMVAANAVGTFVAKPPHPVMVYLRVIGMPLLHAFIKVRAAFRNSWRWLMQTFLFRWYLYDKQTAA